MAWYNSLPGCADVNAPETEAGGQYTPRLSESNTWGDLIQLGASFDWITPALAFLRDFKDGDPAHFSIKAAYMMPSDVKEFMKRYNIKSWGHFWPTYSDHVLFTVTGRDARRTVEAFHANGIELEYISKKALG